MKVVLNMKDINNINFFQNVTRSQVIDCIEREELYFLVANGQYGLAVGKNGVKIKHAEERIGKKIKLFEYSDDLETFVRNLVPEAKTIAIKNSAVMINVETRDRAKVIGKNGKNIEVIKEFLSRQFDIKAIKVR